MIAPDIIKAADEHELAMIEKTPEIDAAALAIHKESPQKAREYLTNYSINTAQALFNKWVKLDQYLLLKYVDGYVKRENEDGTFQDNGSGKNIPAGTIQPGFTEMWKKAVIEQAGERLKVIR